MGNYETHEWGKSHYEDRVVSEQKDERGEAYTINSAFIRTLMTIDENISPA